MRRIYLFTILLLLLISCNDKPKILKGNSERTILAYLGGDNNLSSEVSEKVQALISGWNSNMGKLIIFTDTYDKNPSLIQLQEVDGSILPDTLRTYHNTNSASAELFKEVISDTRKYASSKSYGLILFSHATGWLPERAFENPKLWTYKEESSNTRSLIRDKDVEMEFSDFISSIPNNMFDFMIFDMCFMASVETAYALRNKTEYIVASAAEILSPGFTHIYSKSLSMLYLPKPKLRSFSQSFFDYFNGLEGKYKSAVISVIKTSEMETLASMTKKYLANKNTDEFTHIQVYDRNGKPNLFFDYGSYMKNNLPQDEYSHIDAQLNRIVLFRRNTSKLINISINEHSGLSVYLPQPNLSKLNKEYEKQEWAKALQ